MSKISQDASQLTVKTVSFIALLVGLISTPIAYATGEIKEVIKDQVWAGEFPTPKDPKVKIYFGIERIDDNKKRSEWQTYADSADVFSKGLLKNLARQSKSGKHPKCMDVIEYTGLEEEPFNDLMNTMEKLEMYLPKNREGLNGVSSGIVGLQLLKGNYVVYASKKPVSGRFPFKELKNPELGRAETLKEFQDNFGDIVMSMSAWDVPETPLISHRGIFRNPIDFLDLKKTYGGISLLLHAFSAEALSKMHSGKKFMAVSPTVSMGNIIIKQFKSNEMFIETKEAVRGADGKEIPDISKIPGFSEFKGKIPHGQGDFGGTILIDINAMTKLLK